METQHLPFVYAAHTGSYLDIQGMKIHYYAAGDGDPVLLVHGIGQSAYTWRHNFDALAEKFFVVAPDMIGHGYSSKPNLTYSVEENSEFLLSFLNGMRIKQTHIIAIGSGAVYALDFAIHYPTRVGRLVCVAPGGLTPDFPLILKMMKYPITSKLATLLFGERTLRRLLKECMFDQTAITEADAEEYFGPLDSSEAKEVLRRAISAFDDSEVVSRLQLLSLPILYCWGGGDRWRPLIDSETYRNSTQQHAELIIRNCGHLLHEEKPEKFNETVREFLLQYRG